MLFIIDWKFHNKNNKQSTKIVSNLCQYFLEMLADIRPIAVKNFKSYKKESIITHSIKDYWHNIDKNVQN